MNDMPEKMSSERMEEFAGLYIVEGDRATPNYRYCRQDAPKYQWDYKWHLWCKVPRTGGKMQPIVEAAECAS